MGRSPKKINSTSSGDDPQLLYDKAIECLNDRSGLPQKKTEAFALMHRAASLGLAPAQYSLARKYAEGQGVARNYTEAIRWYTLAANQGILEAQYNLGEMYTNDKGVPVSYSRAFKWYKLAAELGYPPAQRRLAKFYYHDTGIPKNDKVALCWYKRAADQHDADAQYRVGKMYEEGKDVAQDYSEALRWYKLAAGQGYDFTCHCFFFVGEITSGRIQNPTEAIKTYRLAATQDVRFAQAILGALYQDGCGVSRNYSKAFRWYKLAAKHGNIYAQLRLAVNYKNGIGVTQSFSKAFQWYKLAAEQENVEAQSKLGFLYENGLGVAQNYSEALRWYKLAAEHGFDEASEAVRRLEHSTMDKHQEPPASSHSDSSRIHQSPDVKVQALLNELNAMTGLANVKSEIYQLVQYARVQKMRSSHGLQSDDISLHSVFTGSPGTGKTTVARLYGQMLKELGFLSKGHLVETDRTGLVAGYVGQTELKTDEKIREALGGILFIDEAYSLFKADVASWDYGQEVISVLLKRMEDHRDDLVVIVAGYPAPMEAFLNSNEGLRSRFSNFIHFDDYSPDELLSILQYFCNKSNYKMTSDAAAKASVLITQAYNDRDQRFGNARYVRNLFESIRKNQSVRIAETFTNPTLQQLTEILPGDMPS